MKKLKSQIVYDAFKSKSDGEYCHWYVRFWKIEYNCWNGRKMGEWSQGKDDLLTLKIQMDKERGHSLPKAYGGRCDDINVNGCFADAKKVLNGFEGLNGGRSLAKICRKYKRYFYGDHALIPWVHKKRPGLWYEAMKQGFEL